MIGAVADTSVFIAAESGRTMDVAAMPDIIRVSIITIGELRQGVLAATDTGTRARRMATLTRALGFEPVPVTDAVAESWARLRVELIALGRSMPVNDSWIAATAISLGIPLVTQDDDYVHAPGLEVIHV